MKTTPVVKRNSIDADHSVGLGSHSLSTGQFCDLDFGVFTAWNSIDDLPFLAGDATAGVENELQAVVIGNRDHVDMPINIKNSNYFKNILAEAKSGNSPEQVITALESFLENNQNNVWENSWVRFPRSQLSTYANEVFERDLLFDKRDIFGPQRSDKHHFTFQQNGQEYIRIPISYLLKLSLADVISFQETENNIVTIGNQVMSHFLSDNTSPETLSFSPVPVTSKFNMGKGIVDETLIRFALCQFLTQYANSRFRLSENGQKALVYFAPNPPARQKQLNELITDSFYRELFMSPCLSGWDRGEEKKQYMALCHRVLSLSQMNAIFKLREAGIITRNLVVLPNTSNISLANNGTHVSIGSKKLTRLLADSGSTFTEKQEKHIGDLVIKITEHFVPLFIGLYSAAPYRLDFTNFHPERLLGFLPHELEATHLRMIWRRWKKKADLKFMGQSMTPFGPIWLDRAISRLLHLKGDFVPDFRLLDYFVSLLSTEQSPALNGVIGNDDRLKSDLASLGIFDDSMSTYLQCRLRQFSQSGFSGFECRHYSQFKDISTDMTHAVNLQLLIIALAYKYVLHHHVTHGQIPDSPFIESERRQIVFSAAIGLPTFFVRKNSNNRFLGEILKDVKRTRPSRRYNGYVRVHVQEHLNALLRKLKKDGEPLIQEMGLAETIRDLEKRLTCPERFSAAGKLTSAILDKAGARNPMKLSGSDFNSAAENYYRNDLRKENMEEAMKVLESHAGELDSMQSWRQGKYNESLMSILKGKNAMEFITAVREDAIAERLPHNTLVQLIQLTLLIVGRNKNNSCQTGNCA
ncbi:hypothetical protein KJ966_06570 [bacterium]|nr:hypothetical protein [bacterium]